MQERRSIGQMPVLHRHAGLSAVERHKEKELWGVILMLLQGITAAAAVISLLHPIMVQQALAFIVLLINSANSMRNTPLAPRRIFDRVIAHHFFIVYQGNFNRGINSFTDNECSKLFRFRKPDLFILLHLLGVPQLLPVKGGPKLGFMQGEYAFLYTLNRLW